MHGEVETSQAPRLMWVAVHAAEMGVGIWLTAGGGIEQVGAWFGEDWPAGNSTRQLVLAAFCVVLWVRMSATALWLLKRRLDWREAWSVIAATGLYQVGFSFLGAGNQTPLAGWGYVGVLLYTAGAFLNTESEIQRYKFKRDPANRGHLFTDGLFGVVRHPNYLGDILWLLGWAMVTGSTYALIIPAVAGSAFALLFIPKLTTYLKHRYGAEFEDWARRTPRLVPMVW